MIASQSLKPFFAVLTAGALVILASTTARAQTSKSEPLAKQLAAALDAAKLDSIAAADPANPGVYVGALYIPHLQLIVVGAKLASTAAQDARIASKAFRDVYLDLSAGGLEQKVLVEDMAADGAKVRRRTDKDPIDRAEIGGKQVVFDYDFKRQKMSLDEYVKAYTATDERYAAMLQALIDQVKKN